MFSSSCDIITIKTKSTKKFYFSLLLSSKWRDNLLQILVESSLTFLWKWWFLHVYSWNIFSKLSYNKLYLISMAISMSPSLVPTTNKVLFLQPNKSVKVYTMCTTRSTPKDLCLCGLHLLVDNKKFLHPQ
jgi:hypothetical protein